MDIAKQHLCFKAIKWQGDIWHFQKESTTFAGHYSLSLRANATYISGKY
jgi:hypothetical protein